MREKQQKSWPRATALLAVAGCVIGGLGASAAAMPAFAAPASHAAPAADPNLKVAGQPVGMVFDPTTHAFWIAEFVAGGEHDLVDRIAETGHKDTPLNVTSGVDAIAVDSTRGFVWTTGNSSDNATHTVSLIKESSNAVSTVTVPANSALTALAVDPTSGTVFVLDQGGEVFTIAEANPASTPVKLIPGPLGSATGIAVDHATGKLWVVNSTGNSVVAFNETTGAAIGSPAAVGSNPGSLAVDTTTKTVWVTNADGTISEFAEASPGTVKSFNVANIPTSITAVPAKGMIWVGTVAGTVVGISEKTTPASIIGTLTLTNQISGLAGDPTSGQLWAAEQITSQGTFDNIFPFVPAASTITSPTSTWFATNNPLHAAFQVKTGGFPPAQFSISGAPSFLSMGELTGILSGKLTTKSKLGAFTFTIKASNGIGKAASQAFTLDVGTDPSGVSSAATFAIGVKNTFQLQAKATPAATFQAVGLPSGVTVSKTGLLSGSIAKGTKSPVKFFLLTSNKVTQAFNQPVESIFSINLAPGKVAKITSKSSVTFTHGKKSSFTVKSTGFPTPTLTEKGNLPKGLKFSAAKNGTATISGTPATADKGHTTKITITATNGVGKKATQTFSIKIT